MFNFSGAFVKHIMNELLDTVNTCRTVDASGGSLSASADDVTSRADDVTATCGLTRRQMRSLLVQNKHHQNVPFCDMGEILY